MCNELWPTLGVGQLFVALLPMAEGVGFPFGPGFGCACGTTPNPSHPNASKAVCSLAFLAHFVRYGRSGIRTSDALASTHALSRTKRKGWDSNPRYHFWYTVFPGLPFKPLTHLSALGGTATCKQSLRSCASRLQSRALACPVESFAFLRGPLCDTSKNRIILFC